MVSNSTNQKMVLSYVLETQTAIFRKNISRKFMTEEQVSVYIVSVHTLSPIFGGLMKKPLIYIYIVV